MKVYINQNETEVPEGITVKEWLDRQQIAAQERMEQPHTGRRRQDYPHSRHLRRITGKTERNAMKYIGITPEGFLPGEECLIAVLLDHGLDRLHLRKPGASRHEAAQRRGTPQPSQPRATRTG